MAQKDYTLRAESVDDELGIFDELVQAVKNDLGYHVTGVDLAEIYFKGSVNTPVGRRVANIYDRDEGVGMRIQEPEGRQKNMRLTIFSRDGTPGESGSDSIDRALRRFNNRFYTVSRRIKS